MQPRSTGTLLAVAAGDGQRSSLSQPKGSLPLIASIAVVAVIGLGTMWLVLFGTANPATDQAADLGATPGVGRATSTTTGGPFELSNGPFDAASTTLILPGDPTTQQTTTTMPTTTLPGSDSPDQVCRAITAIYDASRTIGNDAVDQTEAVKGYTTAIAGLGDAVRSSDAPNIVSQRSALIDLMDSSVAMLEANPSSDQLAAVYQRMTDTSTPRVVAMVDHLRFTCPDVATTLERGLQ